jgi:hypothetical protein
MNSGLPGPMVRLINAAFVPISNWPIVKVFGLARGSAAVELGQHRPCSGNQDTRQGVIGK